MEVNILQIKPEDIKICYTIMEFFNKNIEKYPFVPREKKITRKEITEKWILNKDTISFYASNEFNEFLGSIALNPLYKNEKMYRGGITLRPKFKGKGIGSSLIKYACEEAQQKGIIVINDVHKKNQAMKKIMENNNFSLNPSEVKGIVLEDITEKLSKIYGIDKDNYVQDYDFWVSK